MNAPMRVDRPWQLSSRWFAAALLAATASSSCSDRLVLGEQCPSPALSESAPSLDGGPAIYGTSCAPCDRIPAMTRRIAILGATGSVGESTLDVIARHPGRFAVGALTAHSQWEKLARLCRVHQPQIAVLADPEGALELERALGGR